MVICFFFNRFFFVFKDRVVIQGGYVCILIIDVRNFFLGFDDLDDVIFYFQESLQKGLEEFLSFLIVFRSLRIIWLYFFILDFSLWILLD